MNRDSTSSSLSTRLLGQSFVHPIFDYLIIGGGLSLLVMLWIHHAGRLHLSISFGDDTISLMAMLILLTNSTHFASSTVRLYTKPGATEDMPFLTLAFPVVAFLMLTLCIFEAGTLGPHLQSLYLTWSPFHYAAQAYGLAVMYSMHSGCRLRPLDKKLLRWVCLLPFLLAIVQAGDVGIGWLLPRSVMMEPQVIELLLTTQKILTVLIFASPIALFFWVWRQSGMPMPFISLLVVITNGVWWATLSYRDAFVWATVFHGVQYLAIVTIFHLKDQRKAGDPRSAVHHVARFYATSLVLAYGLFALLPHAYVLVGFGFVESMLLVVAAINVHHFIVDAFIWRLSRGGNRAIVEQSVPAAT
ncbi:hypothetical protein MK489_20120 [Myxococcota bacterium]|nr:hypothetical protein [Myxococcota bacterium]